MPRVGKLKPSEIAETQPHDFTTVCDLNSAKILSEGFIKLWPSLFQIDEERVKENPRILLHAGDKEVLYIDPVDASDHLKDGIPGFGMFVERLKSGVTEMVWILTAHKEQGEWDHRMVIAARGLGAWVRHGVGQDYERLPRFDRRPAMQEAAKPVGLCDFKYFVPEYPFRPDLKFRAGAQETAIEWRPAAGSARYYTELALGRAQVMFSAASKPWDHAASLVIEELGGIVTTMSGAPYSPTQWRGGVAAASNHVIYDLAFADTLQYMPDGSPQIEPALERFRLPTANELRNRLMDEARMVKPQQALLAL